MLFLVIAMCSVNSCYGYMHTDAKLNYVWSDKVSVKSYELHEI